VSVDSLMRPIRVIKPARIVDNCLIAPILACAYGMIVSPMLMFLFPGADIETPRIENKIFWPIVTVIALGSLASRSRSRFTWPPHIVWFAAYLALAGASTLWSLKPDISFSRFATQMMILISVMPLMFADRRTDIIPKVFYFYVVGSILNAGLIIGGFSVQSTAMGIEIGYPGYFSFKGELGEFAAFAFLFSLYEVVRSGWRRPLVVLIVATSIYLVLVSQSKGSLGCAVIAAILAIFISFVGKKMSVSPAIALAPLVIGYAVLSQTLGNLIERISWRIYGNYTLSGRTYIWDLVDFEIAKRPLLGWGYRSIWLVGPDSPAKVDAQKLPDTIRWVGNMPSAHNGYLDTMLDTGYIGLGLLVIFIFATFGAIGRVAARDPARAWLLLSIAIFISLQNFLETAWLRGADTLWLMFVVVAAETARYWQPVEPVLRATGQAIRRRAVAGPRRIPLKAGGGDWLPRSPDIST
jgi:exopolysaccharide production protein ExoQ